MDQILKSFASQVNVHAQDMNTVHAFLRFLKNRAVDGRETSYGLLVQYEDASQYDKLITFLDQILEEHKDYFPYELAGITEEQLQNSKLDLSTVIKKNQILVFKRIAEDGSLENLISLFRKMPAVIKIIGAPATVIENRLSTDSELRFRMLPKFIHLGKLSSSEITDRFVTRMKDQYVLSDEFEQGIAYYIETIYQGADLSEFEFIDDLVLRIERQMEEEEGINAYLGGVPVDETFVPFSLKVNKRKEEEQPVIDIEEKIVEALEGQPTAEKKEEITDFPAEKVSEKPSVQNEAEIHKQNPQTAEHPHMDVMVLAMSTFPYSRIIRCTDFTTEEQSVVKGRSQLDPIPKYVAQKLEMQGECLDQIIILATDETLKNVEITTPEGEIITTSPVEYFKNQVRGYLNPEGIDNPEEFDKERFIIIPAKEKNPAEGIGEILKVLRKNPERLRLHMAMNGGLRGVQRMLEAMVVLLKMENISVEGAYSIETERKRIIDETDRLKIFHFVAGMNEFHYDGRINALTNYLNEDNELTKAIRLVSDGISWCNVDDFEAGIQNLNKYFTNGRRTEGDPYLNLFEQTIYNDYKTLLSEPISVIEEIRWCRSKGLYQQALTLLEARISKTLMDSGALTWNLPDNSVIRQNDMFNSLVASVSSRHLNCNQFNRITENDFRNFIPYVNNNCKCQVKTGFNFNDYTLNMQGAGSYHNPFIVRKNNAWVRFLFLHKTLKKVRNKVNHPGEEFRYDKRKIDLALDYYIKWAEQIIS